MSDVKPEKSKGMSAAEAAEYGGFRLTEEPSRSAGDVVAAHFELPRDIADELAAATAQLSQSDHAKFSHPSVVVEHALRAFLAELRRTHNGGRPFERRPARASSGEEHTPDGWYD